MKSFAYLILIFLSANLMAGNDKNQYVENMMQAKAIMDSSHVEQSFVTAAGYFERIAAVDPSEWLPHYYAAFCYTEACHLNTDPARKDMWVDKAQAEADRAVAMQPANAEVIVLKGYVLLARMSIDPSVRGFQFNSETMECFTKARAIDPENPRAWLWQGVNVLHTPEAFGGGAQNACLLIRKSLEKFAAFVPADSLAPDWGYAYARKMAKQCK